METPKPHYLKLKQYILRHITNGDWPPLSRVPSENDLVVKFGVSRMTVNRALRELSDSGVLTRVQGVGTFVAGPKAESAMFEVRSIREEITARGQLHSVQVLIGESVVARPNVTSQFGLESGAELFHTRLLHKANGKPLQLEDRFVNPASAPDYLGIDFQTEIPHQYLMRVAPLERTEHVIEAETANKRLAAQLEIAEGDPVLVLTRRTWSRGQVVTWVRLTYPASRYRFVGTFQVGATLTPGG
ncbi:histidine utilization repressor [Pseudoxanthomonas sp.]|uniref:histidine utilization repressor n=1 Tax=Pseudoxanthomonas sp. TaxID=1871049 RepID=UPI003F7E1522